MRVRKARTRRRNRTQRGGGGEEERGEEGDEDKEKEAGGGGGGGEERRGCWQRFDKLLEVDMFVTVTGSRAAITPAVFAGCDALYVTSMMANWTCSPSLPQHSITIIMRLNTMSGRDSPVRLSVNVVLAAGDGWLGGGGGL